jgi:hypothetical protein
VVGCGKCGDEPSGSCAIELVSYLFICFLFNNVVSSSEDVLSNDKMIDLYQPYVIACK